MAVTLVGFFVARFTFQWVVRPRLVDTVTLTRPLTMFGPPDEQAATAGAWVMSSSTVDGAGHVLPSGAADRVLAEACNLTRTSSEASYMRCADQLGLHEVVKAHPAQPVLDAADLGIDHLPRTRRRPRSRLPLVGSPPHVVVRTDVAAGDITTSPGLLHGAPRRSRYRPCRPGICRATRDYGRVRGRATRPPRVPAWTCAHDRGGLRDRDRELPDRVPRCPRMLPIRRPAHVDRSNATAKSAP